MTGNPVQLVRVGDLKVRLEEARGQLEAAIGMAGLPVDAREPIQFAMEAMNSIHYSLGGLAEDQEVWPSSIIPNPIPDPPFYGRACLVQRDHEAM